MAASALVGDELYIFGGIGNNSGKQELSSHYYYDLHAINLKTMKSRKIWEADKEYLGCLGEPYNLSFIEVCRKLKTGDGLST